MEQKEIESFLQDAGFNKWPYTANTWCKSCNFTTTQIVKITPDGIRVEIYGKDNEKVLVITGGFEILKNTQC